MKIFNEFTLICHIQNKKKYRSLTKTRKFMVNGEVVTSKVQKFISNDGEEKQREHKLWSVS